MGIPFKWFLLPSLFHPLFLLFRSPLSPLSLLSSLSLSLPYVSPRYLPRCVVQYIINPDKATAMLSPPPTARGVHGSLSELREYDKGAAKGLENLYSSDCDGCDMTVGEIVQVRHANPLYCVMCTVMYVLWVMCSVCVRAVCAKVRL